MGFSGYFKFLTDISGYSRSLADVGRYLVLVEFGGIVRLVESSRFLRCGVDFNRNLRLSRFLKFWFRVRVIHYKAFLLATGGGK